MMHDESQSPAPSAVPSLARLPPGFFVDSNTERSCPPRVSVITSASASSRYSVRVRTDCEPSAAAKLLTTTPGVDDVVVTAGDTLWEEDVLLTFAPFDTVVGAAQVAGKATRMAPFGEAAVGVWGMMEKQGMVSSRATTTSSVTVDSAKETDQQQGTFKGGCNHRKGFGCLVRGLAHAGQQAPLTKRKPSTSMLTVVEQFSPFSRNNEDADATSFSLRSFYPTEESARSPVAIATMLAKTADAASAKEQGSSPTTDSSACAEELRPTTETLAWFMHLVEQYSWPVVDSLVSSTTGREMCDGPRVAGASDSVYGLFSIASFAVRLRLKNAANAELQVMEDAQQKAESDAVVALRIRCVAKKNLKRGDEVRLFPIPLIAADAVHRQSSEGMGHHDKLRHLMSQMRSNPKGLEEMIKRGMAEGKDGEQ